MKTVYFIYDLLSEKLELEVGKINNIVIENIQEYRKLLNRIISNDEVLFQNEKFTNKYLRVNNYLELDMNSTKTKTFILKRLTELAKSEEYYVRLSEINSSIITIIDDLSFDLDLEVEYNESIDIEKLLKSYDIQFCKDFEEELDGLFEYIKIMTEVLNLDIIIFEGLYNYYTSEEIILIERYISQRGLLAINFESSLKESCDPRLLIDRDLCVIIA